MKTQHKCMTSATSFPTPDAQPPPRLRATHVRSLRWLDCPECNSIYPPPCYTAVNHYHSRCEGDLAGHFCSISGAKCPISEWSSGAKRRASKARLPVFCKHGFQARHLAGHFCSLSEWSSGEKRRAFKARLPVFCRSGFQTRHLAGHFSSFSEWSSDENRRASKARLPVFCRHGFQARHLAGHFCSISGANGVLQARLSSTPPGSRPLRATPLGTPRREPSKRLCALHPTCADPYQIHNCRSWHAQGASHQGQF